MNIQDFDRLYRRTKRAVGVTSSVVNMKLGRVPAKTLRVLTHVTVENRSSSYTKVRLAIDAGGVIHYIDELITVAANELVVSRSDILLAEGDVFFAELTGTTTGNVLVFTCIGWSKKI